MLDYKQTESGDLDFSSGDLEITESTFQHQRDLLLSQKGHIRDSPGRGIGAVNHLSDHDPESLLRSTRKEFSRDGMKVKSVKVSTQSGELTVDANYEGDS